MKQDEEIQDPVATAEDSVLVDQFAAFAKAYFIYPSNNSRVQDALTLFLETFAKHVAEGESLQIAVRQGHMRSGSGVLDLRKPVLAWFAECLINTGIAFMRLESGVTQDSLSDFLQRLQENCARRERDKRGKFSFEEFWPEDHSGIDLRERQFQGGFIDGQEDIDIDKDAQALRDAFNTSTSEGSDLDGMIELSDSILHRVKRVSGLLKSKGLHNAPGVSINLLEEVVNNLPPDALEDREEATKAVEKVLEKAEPSIAGLVMRSESMVDQQLSNLLSTVVQGFFTSPSGQGEPVKPPPKGGGHPGDDLITDDLNLFLEELEAIPRAEVTLDEQDPFSNSEVIGACLYRLSYFPCDESAKTIYEKLSNLFEGANEESWKVVRAYADLLLGSETESNARKEAENIFEHLRRGDLLGRVRKHGCFDVDSLVFAFPTGFMLFLDSLDERQETDRRELEDFCFRVGDERIRRDEPTLTADGGILRADRAAKILSCKTRDVMPLARIIARHGDRGLRPRLVKYLAGLEIDRPEVAAIGVIEPADRIPPGYLEDVCEGVLNNEDFKPNLGQYTGFLIRTYVESLPNAGEYLEARINAILSLKDFPGADTDALLRDQAKGKGPLGLIRPPKAVRDAVRDVQAHLSVSESEED